MTTVRGMITKGSLFAPVLGLASILLASTQAHANVVINGTRVIYPAQEREITIKLRNVGQAPALIQAWIDRGDPETQPDHADAPFVIMPPIARIDPEKGQMLRVSFIPETLAQDKETVFYFNLLDIPPTPVDADRNYVQIAIRSRIKLFYRPHKLPGTPIQAAKNLQWKLHRKSDKTFALRGFNESAFHISCHSVVLSVNGKTFSSSGNMIAPGQTMDFALNDLVSEPQGEAAVIYKWIGDYGQIQKQKVELKL